MLIHCRSQADDLLELLAVGAAQEQEELQNTMILGSEQENEEPRPYTAIHPLASGFSEQGQSLCSRESKTPLMASHTARREFEN